MIGALVRVDSWRMSEERGAGAADERCSGHAAG